MKKFILLLAIMMVGVVAGMWLCRLSYAPEREVDVQKDTIFVRDTVVVEKPTEIRTEYVAEKILVEVRDTMWLHDTLFIQLPMQKKFYREDTYYAEVSGYNPNLDYLEIYQRTVTISKTETIIQKPSPWRVSLDIGLDYSRMEAKYISPNIGAEIGYKRFSVNAELGVGLKAENMIILEPHPYWKVGVKYSLFRR